MCISCVGTSAPKRLRSYVSLILLVLPSLAAQTPNFASRRDYYLGGFPQVVALGDFNGDGILDFVTEQERVYFGNGDGTFRQGPTGWGGRQIGIALADFDGDGKLDLAWVDGVGGYVAIAFGNGDGSFAAPVFLPLNFAGGAVTVADLNGDGKPDIVAGTATATGFGDGLSVILNLGNRNFGNPTVYLSTQEIYAVAIADLNRDGIPDIAAAVQSGVTLLKGNGDGTFTPGNTLALPHPAGTIVLTDLNHDGLIDVVTAGGWLYYTPSVTVFLATGGGAFGTPQSIPYPNGTFAVAVGDVNQDGYPDLVVATANTVEIALLLNKGNGTFVAGRTYTGAGEVGLVLAPLRKPGLLDLVAAGFGSGMVSVLLNQGKGIYQDGLHLPYPSGTGPPATADFNGDGHPDVAITTGSGVSILLGTGKPASPFKAGASISLAAYQTIAGDFNGDGHQDLGRGSDQRGDCGVAGPRGWHLWVADHHHDWKHYRLLHLRRGFQWGSQTGPGDYSHPDLVWQRGRHVSIPTRPAAGELAVPDDGAAVVDGAGRPQRRWKTDLAIVEGGNLHYLVTLINAGNGVFRKPNVYEMNASLQSQIAVADFNGDGHPDVVISAEQYGFYILLGNGDGTFQPPTLVTGPDQLGYGIVVGDFNNDGKPDVALSTNAGCGVAVFSGNGDGTFQPPMYFGTGLYSTFLITGEFQGQPKRYKPDLVVATESAIDILLNRTR